MRLFDLDTRSIGKRSPSRAISLTLLCHFAPCSPQFPPACYLLSQPQVPDNYERKYKSTCNDTAESICSVFCGSLLANFKRGRRRHWSPPLPKVIHFSICCK